MKSRGLEEIKKQLKEQIAKQLMAEKATTKALDKNKGINKEISTKKRYRDFFMKKQTNQALVYMLGLIGIFLTFTIISQIATQYLAKSFNYSPSLGETLFYGFL